MDASCGVSFGYVLRELLAGILVCSPPKSDATRGVELKITVGCIDLH